MSDGRRKSRNLTCEVLEIEVSDGGGNIYRDTENSIQSEMSDYGRECIFQRRAI